MAVKTRQEGKALIVELDNPPVNAIGQTTRAGLMSAVSSAKVYEFDRVILTGTGRAFAAGADAREFDAEPEPPHLPDVLDAIEASPVPWIAAINGVALGGGAELAMACRMRIMAPGAQIGLPEVTLGVIPGAGGTQRLPRLVGLAKALEMIAGGRPIAAEAALEAGLIDRVDSSPLPAAMAVPLDELNRQPTTRSLPAPPRDAGAIKAAKDVAAKKMRGQIAPVRAITCIEAGLDHPFEAAQAQERETFLSLRGSAQARALRHAFFSERAAKLPKRLQGVVAAPLDHIAVVGGGTMGAAISYAILRAGMRVSLLEADAGRAEKAGANVERIIAASQTRGLIDETDAEGIRRRLSTGADYSEAEGAGLAIEAAFEDMEVKREIFGKLDGALGPEAVLATNTSYLDINEIAAGLPDPSRVLGLHFFAPAHIMKLLEIVQGAATSDRALATGFQLAKVLRKVPVLAGVCDGFIGNRIFSRYREAADTVMMDGAMPWDIDAAMRDFGYAMGLYETQDLSGLDIGYANRRRQDATRDPKRRYIPIADHVVEAGRLGRKTGMGWYRYAEDGSKETDPEVEAIVLDASATAGVTRQSYSADEIRDRLLLAMINEAADILDEGIAQSATDIDLVTRFGYAFPRWRGGLMHYADTIGAAQILERIEALAQEDPIAWAPSPLLRRAAETGTPLADMQPTR